MKDSATYQCRDCGREYEFDGELVDCWCGKERSTVVKPCAICGDPIESLDICKECADESEIDAFTHPNEVWERAYGAGATDQRRGSDDE